MVSTSLVLIIVAFSYLLVTIKSIQCFCGLVLSLEYSAYTLSFRLDCILNNSNMNVMTVMT